jgi:anti-anti-sigma regulatory factor
VRSTIDRTKARTEVGLSILHRPTRTIVMLGGDIDIATAPALRDRLPDRVLRPWRDRA